MARQPAVSGEGGVALPELNLGYLDITIIGDSPLIVHAWSEKAKGMMLSKQTKTVVSRGREAKDPYADFMAGTYRLNDGRHGIPAVSIKNAAVTACTSVAGITKIAARQAFFVEAERTRAPGGYEGSTASTALIPLLALDPPIMREDLVRVGMGTADLRYRPEYWPWACAFRIRFNHHALSAEQILNLMDTAGFAVGLHEYRPERSGDYGQFHVARDDEADFQLLRTLHPVRDANIADLERNRPTKE